MKSVVMNAFTRFFFLKNAQAKVKLMADKAAANEMEYVCLKAKECWVWHPATEVIIAEQGWRVN